MCKSHLVLNEKSNIIFSQINMKLTCEQKDLSLALSIVNRAISSGNTLLVLNNILIKAEGKKLFFTATNLEIAINYFIEANVMNEGAITIPAKVFTNYVSLLKSGEVTLEVTEGLTLNIKAHHENIKIKGIKIDEFPLIPQIEKKESFKISANMLSEMANQVTFSASNNLSRPVLMGVLFELKNDEFKMVTTDSYRLSERSTPLKSELEFTCIIPSRTISELAKVLEDTNDEVTVYISKNQVLFEQKALSLTSRLIEGNFPDYKKIIPKESKTSVKIDKEAFILGVKKTNLFVREHNSGVRVGIGGSSMMIQTEENQVGEGKVEVDIEKNGEDNEIALNAQFLLDVLTQMKDKDIMFELDGKLSPVTIKSEKGDGYLHIIMPLRV